MEDLLWLHVQLLLTLDYQLMHILQSLNQILLPLKLQRLPVCL